MKGTQEGKACSRSQSAALNNTGEVQEGRKEAGEEGDFRIWSLKKKRYTYLLGESSQQPVLHRKARPLERDHTEISAPDV